jgi:hypothetical protein
MVADAERWDAAQRTPLQLDVWLPSISSLAIRRPPEIGAFQFVILSKLRAAQLMRGCRPRVDGSHKATVTAQLEVSAGKVSHWLAQEGRPATLAAVPIDDVPVMVVEV